MSPSGNGPGNSRLVSATAATTAIATARPSAQRPSVPRREQSVTSVNTPRYSETRPNSSNVASGLGVQRSDANVHKASEANRPPTRSDDLGTGSLGSRPKTIATTTPHQMTIASVFLLARP